MDTQSKEEKLSAAVDRLLAAYPLIASDNDMPPDGRAGYLTAVVRSAVDDDLDGLDHLPNGSLFQLIRGRLTEG